MVLRAPILMGITGTCCNRLKKSVCFILNYGNNCIWNKDFFWTSQLSVLNGTRVRSEMGWVAWSWWIFHRFVHNRGSLTLILILRFPIESNYPLSAQTHGRWRGREQRQAGVDSPPLQGVRTRRWTRVVVSLALPRPAQPPWIPVSITMRMTWGCRRVGPTGQCLGHGEPLSNGHQ